MRSHIRRIGCRYASDQVAGLVPDQAFSNLDRNLFTALDFGKNVHPFGTDPKPDHCLYLASQEAFQQDEVDVYPDRLEFPDTSVEVLKWQPGRLVAGAPSQGTGKSAMGFARRVTSVAKMPPKIIVMTTAPAIEDLIQGDVQIQLNPENSQDMDLSKADLDWVTVSPKPPAAPRLQRYSEVKAVLDDADPEQWIDLATVRFIQPLWSPVETVRRENEARAAQYVMDHPWWKLSVQTHKVLGIR